MLEIKNITKIYKTGTFTQKALDGVSVSFRKNEFASILGPSGSGKTTLLNIIGGLDKYTDGDLIINGTSTKEYKDSSWDSYRNHRIGFVFQNYNLISHQTILSNVKLALTLSGISKKEAEEKAKKALKEVGLEKHIYKKPNQLSGGQMQRVAIARALVNDPEILLADEPTGALDSETSIQIMKILKKISKNKLVIMVTHNPELAKEYSNRIITLKDGKITSDSNPYKETKNKKEENKEKTKKTSMSFLTALSLSFNNLMTKKARTILVAFAGSIGIIGIALILAVSTGFQNYVDSIGKETLTSYPLNIMQESTDITSMLLSMTNGDKKGNGKEIVKEEQYITDMLSTISTNDLKSFKKYLEENKKEVDKNVSTIKYSYNIDPPIYTKTKENKLNKVNPSNLFNSIYGSSMLSSYSSMASIYTEMIDNKETLNEQYEVLKGRWPKKYNEMVIVLSEPNSISDLLVYSLGFKDNDELSDMIEKIMSGKTVQTNSKPLTLTYDDLMNVDLRLVMPTDTYKYSTKYRVYEDMSENKTYMNQKYETATKLKIVGIVTAKEGTNSTALNPGVAYTKELIDYIIDYSKEEEIVKKQLQNEDIDVFSGKTFKQQENNFDFKFEDLVSVDETKMKQIFGGNFDSTKLEQETKKSMEDISSSITTDTSKANKTFTSTFNTLSENLFNNIKDTISLKEVDSTVTHYLSKNKQDQILSNLEQEYVIPKSILKNTYSGLLKSLLTSYIYAYYATDKSLTEDDNNPVAKIDNDIKNEVEKSYKQSALMIGITDKMSSSMTEAKTKKDVLTKVGNLTINLTNSIAGQMNIDPNSIAGAFKLNFTEDELMRVVSAMMSNTKTNSTTNLSRLGYQDKESPTYISFYFNSFEGKENFIKFLNNYNDKQKKLKHDDKVINYTDATGILIDSVKTIVNAVSYVLIAFVSISLVVSSIMIGVITYISVYERTKEIGILRSIGASKHNISSIFNAETAIIGLLSGIFGIGISYGSIPIINAILHHYTGNVPISAKLDISSGIILVILSIILTLIGGLIPAKKASRKDPVEALRSE